MFFNKKVFWWRQKNFIFMIEFLCQIKNFQLNVLNSRFFVQNYRFFSKSLKFQVFPGIQVFWPPWHNKIQYLKFSMNIHSILDQYLSFFFWKILQLLTILPNFRKCWFSNYPYKDYLELEHFESILWWICYIWKLINVWFCLWSTTIKRK